MSKHLYKHFNYLQVVYSDGSFEIAKDESSLIWARFRAFLENFSLKAFVGVLSISVLDNAKRKIVTVNLDCYGNSNSISF